jgi:hypothetical protein
MIISLGAGSRPVWPLISALLSVQSTTMIELLLLLQLSQSSIAHGQGS